ncbi:unnamed protein product [Effrenium voratum]|nr:unnamed protein product [Effrenium voratum]
MSQACRSVKDKPRSECQTEVQASSWNHAGWDGRQTGRQKADVKSLATGAEDRGDRLAVALGDPFAKCSGSVTDPIGCCNNQPSTCQNPPNPFNLSTACGLGQACDADTLSGGYGTCKCLAGTCSADGKSCSL